MAGNRNVLVTGATGFVGRHVVAGLDNCTLTVASRTPALTMSLPIRRVIIPAIDSTTDWGSALDGVDAVIHLAGIAHRSARFRDGNADLYAEVNTRGTLRLAEAAARAGVRDFIFASSIHVNGASTDGRAPFRESDVPRPIGPYAESKARAEDGLATIAAAAGMAITIIRPPVIHGAGARGNIARIETALRRGAPLPFATIRNRRAFLGVDNLVAFLGWRLARTNSGADTFILADEEQPSTPGFIRHLGTAMDRRPRLLPFPTALLRTTLKAMGRHTMAEGLLGSLAVDTTRATTAGWQPPFTLEDGLRRAFAGPSRHRRTTGPDGQEHPDRNPCIGRAG